MTVKTDRRGRARYRAASTGTLCRCDDHRSASKEDERPLLKHKGKPAVHGFKAHVGATPTPPWSRKSQSRGHINDGKAGPAALPEDPGRCSPTAPIGARIFASHPCERRHAGIIATACGTRRARNIGAARCLEPAIHRVRGRSKRSSAHGSAVMASSHAMAWPRKASIQVR